MQLSQTLASKIREFGIQNVPIQLFSGYSHLLAAKLNNLSSIPRTVERQREN